MTSYVFVPKGKYKCNIKINYIPSLVLTSDVMRKNEKQGRGIKEKEIFDCRKQKTHIPVRSPQKVQI